MESLLRPTLLCIEFRKIVNEGKSTPRVADSGTETDFLLSRIGKVGALIIGLGHTDQY